jgi:hypothetical protein
VAVPDERATVLQMVVAPFLNVTVPVGVAVDGELAVTVAVKVAEVP